MFLNLFFVIIFSKSLVLRSTILKSKTILVVIIILTELLYCKYCKTSKIFWHLRLCCIYFNGYLKTMSINVTVNGNTLSKTKGKMVSTSDPNLEKVEFNKRRRIRLEQVRQQSKNIAESVRNKVKNEKKKQLSDFEKKGERELKKWQAKKLLTLQQQYHECLKDIGLGHVQAAIEEESDEAEEIRKENYAKIAKHRGQMALDRLNQEKNQEETEKYSSENKRKYNQAVENARAVLVANLKSKNQKRTKRKELTTNINISGRLTAGSDTESESPKYFNLSSRCTSPSTSCSPKSKKSCSPTPRICSPPPRPRTSSQPPRTAPCRPPSKAETCPGPCNQSNVVKSIHNLENNERTSCRENDNVALEIPICPGDTRISDRIRSRTAVDICGIDVENGTCSNRLKTPPIGPRENSQPRVSDLVQNDNGDAELDRACARKSDVQVIPKKPPVTLRSTNITKEVPSNKKSACSSHLDTDRSKNKTLFYDHKNRFSKQYTDDKVNVHKIDQDSIEVCPSSGSEAEYKEKMYKRDQDAVMRGKKALEKVKVQKDYREMMQQLPKLQKQEKIASIPLNNPKFHMSKDRLKEREQKNQNCMEGAYEKLFPKTCTVTIPAKPPKKTITSTLPYQTITVSEDSPMLNVATWDVDAKPEAGKPKSLESQVANNPCCKCPPVDAENVSKKETTENLQGMLKSLTTSRNKLFEELASLPEGSQLHNFLAQNGGLSGIDEIIKVSATVKDDGSSGPSGRKRSRSKGKRSSRRRSSNRADSQSSSNKRSTSPSKPKPSSKQARNYSAESSRSPSPPSDKSSDIAIKPDKATKPVKSTKQATATKPSKPKTSPHPPPLEPLVLQNIGTQTTPRAGNDPSEEIKPAPVSPKAQKAPDSPKVVSKSAGKDKAKTVADGNVVNATNQGGKGESCEIIIRIGEDGKPKICVNPVELRNKEIIVRTGIEEMVETSEVGVQKPVKQLIKESGPKSGKKLSVSSGKTKKGTSKHKIRQEHKEKAKEAKVQDKTMTSQTNKDTSWREYLSQNSNTSSTSYFSPPTQNVLSGDCKCLDSMNYKSFPDEEHIRMYHPQFSHLLQNNSQQGNLKMPNIRSKSVDPSLVEFIKKLLAMSRNTIDELAVSSVSDISTPSSSVVNISTNIKVHQIKDAMKRFNIDVSNINQVLNYSADESNPHYNTAESLTVSSFGSKCNCVTLSKNCKHRELQKSEDARNLSLDEYCSENYAGVLSTYNQMAESYSKRIESLSTMIDKLRSEKSNALFSPSSERDSSTKYLELPSDFKSKSRNSSADEQEELNRYLLSTDYGLIEPLQKPTPVKSKKSTLSNESDELKDSIDKELKKRFDSLLSNYTAQTAPLPEIVCCPNPCDNFNKNDSSKEDVPFVPLLLDIPRLPKFESYSERDNCLCKPCDKSKPPISKGLVSAKRFNNDISIAPHELSTIAEAEMSNKIQRTPEKSTRSSANVMSNFKPFVILPQPEHHQKKPIDIVNVSRRSSTGHHSTTSTNYDSLSDLSKEETASAGTKKTKKTSLTSSENPYKQENTIMFQQIVPKAMAEVTSDSSVDELENMENMLKSLGMGWAISTLRKTQDALNLQSSSSSLDISVKKSIKITESNSSSDISFRDILSKQFLNKLSSSSLKSDDSSTLSPYLEQFQNMTPIQPSDGSQERTTQRTSTPIQSNRTTDRSKTDSQPNVILSAESELSSIKEYLPSTDQQFYSLDDTTLTKNTSNND